MLAHCAQVFQPIGMFVDIGSCWNTTGPGNADALVGCFIAEQYFFNWLCICELLQCLFVSMPVIVSTPQNGQNQSYQSIAVTP